MNRFLGSLAAAALVVLAVGNGALAADNSMSSNHMSSSTSSDHMMASSKKVTLTGNLVDLSCYIGSGAHGASHAACAKACLLKGQPFGIETSDGNIVTIFGDGPGVSNAQRLAPFVEKKVTITGTEYEAHGVNGIHIDTIAAAK